MKSSLLQGATLIYKPQRVQQQLYITWPLNRVSIDHNARVPMKPSKPGLKSEARQRWEALSCSWAKAEAPCWLWGCLQLNPIHRVCIKGKIAEVVGWENNTKEETCEQSPEGRDQSATSFRPISDRKGFSFSWVSAMIKDQRGWTLISSIRQRRVTSNWNPWHLCPLTFISLHKWPGASYSRSSISPDHSGLCSFFWQDLAMRIVCGQTHTLLALCRQAQTISGMKD